MKQQDAFAKRLMTKREQKPSACRRRATSITAGNRIEGRLTI
ncbi:hypothetical protein [Herbaspirillum sp.]